MGGQLTGGTADDEESQEKSIYVKLTFIYILLIHLHIVKKIQKAPDIEDFDSIGFSAIASDSEQMSKVLEYNRRYLHWDELRYRVDDDIALQTWAMMKILRNNGIRTVHVCSLDLKYNLLPEFQEWLHHIDRDSAGFIQSENPGERNMRRYVISSLMEEAIASSQIEGAATTRKDAKKMLRTQRKPENISELMIYNNYLAMEHIKETLDRKMDIDLMLEMHKTITKGTLREGSEWEGRFREDNDTVVGDTAREDVVFHVPPAYDRVPGLIQELCDFINNDSEEFVHPVIKGIIVHYLIGYIHPFVNGNGRMARSLYYWYVMKQGYWLMEYTSISRIIKKSQTKYGLAYQYSETDGFDLTYFLKFNLGCVEKSVEDLKEYIERKTAEQRRIAHMIESNPQLNLNEMAILKDYTRDLSTFTVKELSTRYPISYQTARNYVNHLCELGYVKQVSQDRKTAIYSISEDKKIWNG